MIITYASVPQPAVTFSVESGGSLPAGSAWFTAQSANRAGLTTAIAPVQLTWPANSRIRVSIAAGTRSTGADLYSVVISSAPTNTLADFRRVAEWEANEVLQVGDRSYPSQGLPKSLPTSFTINGLRNTLTLASVANRAALPASSHNGDTRYIQSEAKFVTWSSALNLWVEIPQSSWNTYRESREESGGCDRPIEQITSLLWNPPEYPGDNSPSHPVRYWARNAGIAAMAAGESFFVQLVGAGQNQSSVLDGKLIAKINGFIDLTSIQRDTSKAGQEEVLRAIASGQALGHIPLPFDLPTGQAAEIELKAQFFAAELGGSASYGVVIRPSAGIGSFSDFHKITGDYVANMGDRLRVVPDISGLTLKSGEAVIAGYSTGRIKSQKISGLANNQAGQKITLSGPLAGIPSIVAAADPVPLGRAVRAIASTVIGLQSPSAWSDTQMMLVGQAIDINLQYPDTVRANYPDTIRGESAVFNPSQVRIYAKNITTEQVFEVAQLTPVVQGQSYRFTGVSTGAIALPSGVSSSDFGLFDYQSLIFASSANPGNATESYWQFAIAYYYDGTDVSSISSSPASGCLPELSYDLIDAFTEPKTTADFVQPAIESSTQVFVDNTNHPLFEIDGFLNIANGVYQITGISDRLTLTYTGGSAIAPGATVSANSKIQKSSVLRREPVNAGAGDFEFELINQGWLTGTGKVFFSSQTSSLITEIRLHNIDAQGLNLLPVFALVKAGAIAKFENESKSAILLTEVDTASAMQDIDMGDHILLQCTLIGFIGEFTEGSLIRVSFFGIGGAGGGAGGGFPLKRMLRNITSAQFNSPPVEPGALWFDSANNRFQVDTSATPSGISTIIQNAGVDGFLSLVNSSGNSALARVTNNYRSSSNRRIVTFQPLQNGVPLETGQDTTISFVPPPHPGILRFRHVTPATWSATNQTNLALAAGDILLVYASSPLSGGAGFGSITTIRVSRSLSNGTGLDQTFSAIAPGSILRFYSRNDPAGRFAVFRLLGQSNNAAGERVWSVQFLYSMSNVVYNNFEPDEEVNFDWLAGTPRATVLSVAATGAVLASSLEFGQENFEINVTNGTSFTINAPTVLAGGNYNGFNPKWLITNNSDFDVAVTLQTPGFMLPIGGFSNPFTIPMYRTALLEAFGRGNRLFARLTGMYNT